MARRSSARGYQTTLRWQTHTAVARLPGVSYGFRVTSTFAAASVCIKCIVLHAGKVTMCGNVKFANGRRCIAANLLLMAEKGQVKRSVDIS